MSRCRGLSVGVGIECGVSDLVGMRVGWVRRWSLSELEVVHVFNNRQILTFKTVRGCI